MDKICKFYKDLTVLFLFMIVFCVVRVKILKS